MIQIFSVAGFEMKLNFSFGEFGEMNFILTRANKIEIKKQKKSKLQPKTFNIFNKIFISWQTWLDAIFKNSSLSVGLWILTFQLHLTFFSWMRSTRAAGSKHSSHVVANQKASSFSQSRHRRVLRFSCWEIVFDFARKKICVGTKKELMRSHSRCSSKVARNLRSFGETHGPIKCIYDKMCNFLSSQQHFHTFSDKKKEQQWKHYQQYVNGS